MTTPKLSAEQKTAANETLARFDKLAQDIQANHEAWGLDFDAAKDLVNHIDQGADKFEKAVYGEDSLAKRQAEIVSDNMAKEAKVVQRDSDEPYMESFQSTEGAIQTNADEPYMAAYKDDQSSAVGSGSDAAGRRLAPQYS